MGQKSLKNMIKYKLTQHRIEHLIWNRWYKLRYLSGLRISICRRVVMKKLVQKNSMIFKIPLKSRMRKCIILQISKEKIRKNYLFQQKFHTFPLHSLSRPKNLKSLKLSHPAPNAMPQRKSNLIIIKKLKSLKRNWGFNFIKWLIWYKVLKNSPKIKTKFLSNMKKE